MSHTLLSLLLHSTVILGAARLLVYLFRRSSPGLRYKLLFAGFGFLLLWPFLSAALPPLRLLFHPQQHSGALVTVRQTIVLQHAGSAAPALPWPLLVWISGVLLTTLPVVRAYRRVWHIRQQASPLFLELLPELCARLQLRRPPDILLSASPVMPVTFGLFRPAILLPADYPQWPLSRQHAVLLHELAHVQRRDVPLHLLVNIVAALWWFQPLVWINYRCLRRESEQACDRSVIASGMRPSEYAAQLLEIAKQCSAGRRWWPSAAMTMTRSGELASRLHAVLEHPPGPPATLAFLAVPLLALWSIFSSAITFDSEPSFHSPLGGTSMKRTFISGLLSSVGLSAATIGGSLFDPSGAAVSQAKASLYNPETAAAFEAATTPDGKFAFDNLPAGQYILRVEKPGFASLFHEFNVGADTRLERGLTLQPANGHLRVKGTLAQANLVQKAQPVYPVTAKKAGLQGTVNLEVTISKEGTPQEIRVLSSPGDDLTQSALEAVRQWHYKPVLLNGAPVDVITDVVVNYTLMP